MFELCAGDAVLTVDPHDGGRIIGLRVRDDELLLTPADDIEGRQHYGCFVMAPWAGRTRHGRFAFRGVEHQLDTGGAPHAIHGTVRHRPWTVVEQDDHHAVLTCDLGAGWPWPGRVEHAITLGPDGVELTLRLHADDVAFPASMGWHPWWRRTMDDGVAASLDLRAGAMFRKDDEGIATTDLLRPPPPGPWDDCFTELSAPPSLRWDDHVAVAVESDCPTYVVFTERPEAICVEPQTGPPDALNHDPAVVEPDRPVTATARWVWS